MVTSRAKLVFSLAIITGLAGAIPHILFQYNLGDENYYQGAWDESFYMLAMSEEITDWNNYPARRVAQILLNLAGGPGPMFALLSDVVWPVLIILTAGILVLTLTRGTLIVIPAVILVVFSSDILGFNSSAIYPPNFTLSNLFHDLPLDVRRFISDPYVSFLYIFRTPEPQLSLPIYFCYLTVITRCIRQPSLNTFDWILIAIISFACINAYVFFAIGGLIIGILACTALFLVKQWSKGVGLLLILVSCGIWLGFQLFSSHTDEANAVIFSSSLPMLAPSMIYGGILAIIFAWVFRHNLKQNANLIFAIFCLLMPFATLNQQVFTGIMIQTLNWERYINFPALLLGLLLFVERINWEKYKIFSTPSLVLQKIKFYKTNNSKPFLTSFIIILVGIFLIYAQLNTYKQFLHFNILTISYANLIDHIHTTRPNAPNHVILENMSYDAAVRARLKSKDVVINGYTNLVASLGEKLFNDKAESEAKSLNFQTWGFDYASRIGLTVDSYENILLSEIDNNVCWPHLMFVSTFLECAPYVSDFRLYNPDKLRSIVPTAVNNYKIYLHNLRNQNTKPALILLTNPIDKLNLNDTWSHELVGSIKFSKKLKIFSLSSPIELYAYWQKPNLP